MWLSDNNASFPLPTELTTNATFNAEAEAEYSATRTGKCVLAYCPFKRSSYPALTSVARCIGWTEVLG